MQQGQNIIQAAELIRQGELVAFPTETVYGLGANALDEAAVAKIYQAKGRPAQNPLIVHVADEQQLATVVREISPLARKLIDRFWPGPLTLIMPKAKAIPLVVTGGYQTVAVRMPDHPLASELLQKAGVPIAAPSANRSGQPSPTHHQHVIDQLGDTVSYVVTGGAVPLGLESTILDLSQPELVVLRPGALPTEVIAEFLNQPITQPGPTTTATPAPGTAFRHYAPNAPMLLIPYGPNMVKKLQESIRQNEQHGKKVGVLISEELLPAVHTKGITQSMGKNLQAVAHNLYAALHALDRADIDVIIAQSFPQEGLGVAIMDRLERAANLK